MPATVGERSAWMVGEQQLQQDLGGGLAWLVDRQRRDGLGPQGGGVGIEEIAAAAG